MSAEHDLQQLRDALQRMPSTGGAWALQEPALAALSRVGERIDAQQHRIQELESLVARSDTERLTRAVVALRWIDGERIGWPAGMPSGEYWKHVASKRREAARDALADLDSSSVESATEPKSRGPVSGAGGNT